MKLVFLYFCVYVFKFSQRSKVIKGNQLTAHLGKQNLTHSHFDKKERLYSLVLYLKSFAQCHKYEHVRGYLLCYQAILKMFIEYFPF